jgi:hypothetical protein
MTSIETSLLTVLLSDLKIAERSIALNKVINRSFAELTSKIKKDISMILIDLTYTELVMSLARLYDDPSNKYPTKCIKAIYKSIKSNSDKFDITQNRRNVELQFESFGIEGEMKIFFSSCTDRDFLSTSTLYFETLEMNDPITSANNKLKTIRDKVLAHNEDNKIDTLFPYESMDVLLDHAKNVISFYSLLLCGVYLKPNGDFYLSHSSRDWEIKYGHFINSVNGL